MPTHPATDPAVVMSAYRSHSDGCCVTMKISSRSGTCGNDNSDESSSATRKRPGAPRVNANDWTAATTFDMQRTFGRDRWRSGPTQDLDREAARWPRYYGGMVGPRP